MSLPQIKATMLFVIAITAAQLTGSYEKVAESGALALEGVLSLHCWDVDTNSQIEVTVYGHNSTLLVRPEQILQWVHRPISPPT